MGERQGRRTLQVGGAVLPLSAWSRSLPQKAPSQPQPRAFPGLLCACLVRFLERFDARISLCPVSCVSGRRSGTILGRVLREGARTITRTIKIVNPGDSYSVQRIGFRLLIVVIARCCCNVPARRWIKDSSCVEQAPADTAESTVMVMEDVSSMMVVGWIARQCCNGFSALR